MVDKGHADIASGIATNFIQRCTFEFVAKTAIISYTLSLVLLAQS